MGRQTLKKTEFGMVLRTLDPSVGLEELRTSLTVLLGHLGFLFFFFFLQPQQHHMEVPWQGVALELQLQAYHNAGSKLHL